MLDEVLEGGSYKGYSMMFTNETVVRAMRETLRTGRAPYGELGDMLRGAGMIAYDHEHNHTGEPTCHVTMAGLAFLRRVPWR